MIKTVAAGVFSYGLLVSLGAYFYINANFAMNVLVGAAVMLFNIAALSFAWKRIFSKKSIALAVFVIIFKYVILVMILWGLSSTRWLNVYGFLIGLASLAFSIFIAMLIKSVTKR